MGYYNLMIILSDPEHEEYLDMLEWGGSKYDPNAFDMVSVNRTLQRIH